MQEPKTMKRLLMAFTAIAAVAGPLAVPMQALAQEQDQAQQERPQREGRARGMNRPERPQMGREDGPPEPCLLYTSPSPRDLSTSRMPSSA